MAIKHRRSTANLSICALGSVVLAVALAGPAAGATGPRAEVETLSESPLRARAQANTSADVLAKLPDGSTVKLLCYVMGEEVSGPFGNSAIWNLVALSDGQTAYAADSFLRTGSDEPVVPGCALPAPSPVAPPVPVQPSEPVATVELEAGIEMNCAMFLPDVGKYLMCDGWYTLTEEQRAKAQTITIGCLAGMSSTIISDVVVNVVSGGGALVITVPKMAVSCVSGGLAAAGFKVLGVNDTGG